MKEPINFEINGMKFQTIPLTGRNVLILNQKVLNVVSSFLISASDKKLKSKIAIGLDALTSALGSLSEEEYSELIEKTLCTTVAIGKEKKDIDVRLSDLDVIGNVFSEHPMDIYQVLFKIWELNKLGPFDNGAIGASTQKTEQPKAL